MYMIFVKAKYEDNKFELAPNLDKVMIFTDYNKAIRKVRDLKKKDNSNTYIIRKM